MRELILEKELFIEGRKLKDFWSGKNKIPNRKFKLKKVIIKFQIKKNLL